MAVQRILWPAFVLATVLFYSVLLFAPEASIHWDLADVYYPVQKHISDLLHTGSLPSWTPYLFSGTPLGADPQSGLWYPLHWLFFLIGVTPRLMAWEIALHAFLALSGAYLLARSLFGDPLTAILSGVFYAWGAFFAANNPELPLFEAAALFPWLLWTAHRSLESDDWRWHAGSGGVAGAIVLTGDFDAAAYCFFGLVCFVAARRAPLVRIGKLLGVVAILALLLGSAVILPWLAVAAETTRTGVYAEGTGGLNLHFSSLGTILSADYLGLMSGRYSGPDDLRHAYFYGGLLSIPLAIAGLFRSRRLGVLLALILPAVWYAFGPAAGLSRVLAILPSFRDVRAPVEIWFVAALGLALAAGSGAAFVTEGTGRQHLPYIFLILTVADLWFWNFYRNPMVLARVSYEQLYERPQKRFEARLADLRKLPFFRIWAPQPVNAFGPLDGALISRMPVTYGYKLLEQQRHAIYKRALPENPRLLNTVATHLLDLAQGVIGEDTAALGLVSSPPTVRFAPDEAASLQQIRSIDPAQATVVEAREHPADLGPATINGISVGEAVVHIRYTAASQAFLRVSIPWAKGWSGHVENSIAKAYPADLAFMGVVVPPGSHELVLTYEAPGRTAGSLLSLAGLGVLAAVLVFARRVA